MNTGSVEVLGLGLVAIGVGVVLLISMVQELGDSQRRKWYLGIGLGAGIIAFSLKIGLIVLFSSFPGQMMTMFPERNSSNDEVIVSQSRYFSSNQKTSYVWKSLPKSAPYPVSNQPSEEKIALGKMLFFDKRLSVDKTLSCASCHELTADKGGGDGLPLSIGIGGQVGNRNAPTVINAAFQRVLFWDGRVASLEEQVKGPLVNPVEMGMPSLEHVVERVRQAPEYRRSFAQVFGEGAEISIENISNAIAAFERTLITPDSPYDRFVNGDISALTNKQLRGMALFESVGCIQCHSGANFSGASLLDDNNPYRIFPAVERTEFDELYRFTEDRGLNSGLEGAKTGVWRIPSLRNVSLTAPYFHNGAVESLTEAVRIMAKVQLGFELSNDESADTLIDWLGEKNQVRVKTNQALSDAEVGEIVAFLESLTGTLSGYVEDD